MHLKSIIVNIFRVHYIPYMYSKTTECIYINPLDIIHSLQCTVSHKFILTNYLLIIGEEFCFNNWRVVMAWQSVGIMCEAEYLGS